MSATKASQTLAEDVVSGLNTISTNVEDFLETLPILVEAEKQRLLARRRKRAQQSSAAIGNPTPEAARNTNDAAQSPSAHNSHEKSSVFYAILADTIGPTLKVYDAVTRLTRKVEEGEETDEEQAVLDEAMIQWILAVRSSQAFLDSVHEVESKGRRGA